LNSQSAFRPNGNAFAILQALQSITLKVHNGVVKSKSLIKAIPRA